MMAAVKTVMTGTVKEDWNCSNPTDAIKACAALESLSFPRLLNQLLEYLQVIYQNLSR